jgi:hypothetical protein
MISFDKIGAVDGATVADYERSVLDNVVWRPPDAEKYKFSVGIFSLNDVTRR